MANVAQDGKMMKKADKERKKAQKAEAKLSGKKGKGGLIAAIIIILIIAAAAVMTVFNVFGLRDDILFPLLRDVPLVGNFIPDAPELENGVIEPVGPTVDELNAQIAQYQTAISALEQQLGGADTEMGQMFLELERLREIEAMHIEFQEERQEWERMVAENDPAGFVAFYENFNLEHASELYAEISAEVEFIERRNMLVNTWANMRAGNVADMIETMITTDMPLIVEALSMMPDADRTSIFDQLSAESAAAISRMMWP